VALACGKKGRKIRFYFCVSRTDEELVNDSFLKVAKWSVDIT
jgi:hypothetical protein